MIRRLNSSIRCAPTLADLEQLEQQHGDSFDFIHTLSAFMRAGELANEGGQAGDLGPLLGRLWQRLRPQLGKCGPWALANIVWACGKSAYAEAAPLDTCLARLAASSQLNPIDCANAINGVATTFMQVALICDRADATFSKVFLPAPSPGHRPLPCPCRHRPRRPSHRLRHRPRHLQVGPVC